jgi:flagellar basal-body rod protein FlgB
MEATRSEPLALAEQRLRWLDQRQRVLAQNIANADTPGYRPHDLKPFAEVLAEARGGGAAAAPALLRTSAGHLPPPGSGPDGRARPDRGAVERSPDGNAVLLDQQALKVAETDQAHALAMGLHTRWIAMFRTALGRS